MMGRGLLCRQKKHVPWNEIRRSSVKCKFRVPQTNDPLIKAALKLLATRVLNCFTFGADDDLGNLSKNIDFVFNVIGPFSFNFR